MQKIKTYKDFIEIASLFFALLIAFWIPELKFILSYFIGFWFLLTIAQLNFKTRFKQSLNTRFKKFIFFSQLILFLIIFSELLFAKNTTEVSKNITQKLSFLLFPILFSLSGNKFKQKQYLFLKLFVVSNLIASIVCLLFAFYNSSSIVDGHYVFNPIIYGWHNYFTAGDFSKFVHRGYFSMYLVFSVAITFYFKEKQILFNSSNYKFWFYLLIVFFTVIIFMLESRAGIISLFLIISWYIIYKIFLSRNIYYKIATVVAIVIMSVIVLKSSRIHKTIKILTNIEHEVGRDSDARIVLWTSAINVISDNFFTGIGIENFKEVFSKEYKKYNNKELQLVKSMSYNVHNQFLEVWVLYGFFVFLFFLSIFFVSIIVSIKNKNNLLLAFLFILWFNFLFESVLETISGIVFIVYFLNYFVFVLEKEKSQITK